MTTTAVEKQSITYSDYVTAGFFIQHAERTRLTVICALSGRTLYFLIIS